MMLQRLSFTAVLALAPALVLAGCDKKEEADKTAQAEGEKAEGDKTAVGAEQAEGEKPEEVAKADPAAGENPLVGTWALDAEAMAAGMKEMDEYKNAPDEQKQKMDAMLGQMKEMKMELTFTEDQLKSSTSDPAGETKEDESKYVIKSTEGDKVMVETEMGGQKQTVEFTVDNDKLVMAQGPMKMTFTKKAEG